MRSRSLALSLIALSLLTTGSARAAGWGPRVGATLDPDQIHVGLHGDLGRFSPRVRFQPNFELGFGDNLTVAALNFEAEYLFPTHWDAWRPYAGGGLGLNWVSWDSGDFPNRSDNSDMEVGLNLLGGIEKSIGGGDRLLLELKLGLGDSPDMKLTVGWTFF